MYTVLWTWTLLPQNIQVPKIGRTMTERRSYSSVNEHRIGIFLRTVKIFFHLTVYKWTEPLELLTS